MEGARNWRQGKGPQENGAGSDTKISHSSKCRKKEHMKYRIMALLLLLLANFYWTSTNYYLVPQWLALCST